jgi:signal transduction histidine kinase/integral membrane sensor domain MASE1
VRPLHPAFRKFLGVSVLAAAYFAVGRAGLWLALPPGYATAVWPPAGFALAGVLLLGNVAWPGVFLGSFLVNLSVSFDASSPSALWRSLLVAGGIACGPVLEALFSAALVRRFAGYPDVLTRESRILRLLILGGPVGCLPSATVASAVLTGLGEVSPALFFSTWWTWWVGDAIGVMIFTPLILLWKDGFRKDWRRPAMVSAPLFVTFAVVVGLFIHSSRFEQNKIRFEFDHHAESLVADVEEGLKGTLECLYAIEGFFAGSQSVDRREFRDFVSPLLARHKALHALGWDARVPAAGRAAYERRLREEGFAGFRIVERSPEGTLVPAGQRPEYFPVTYIEPLDGNRAALGFDVASGPFRWEALRRAAATGRATATAPIHLVQDGRSRPGLAIFLPIYKGRVEDGSPEGYAVGLFLLNDMLQGHLRGKMPGVAVSVYDDDAPAERRVLYGTVAAEGLMKRDVALPVAGRVWRFHFEATADYLVQHRSRQSWSLLAGGLLFTGVLGALLLVLTGRTARIEEEVGLRTAELRRANGALAGKQAETEKLMQEVRDANKELNDFAHIVSHDLKAPLRGISALGGWLLEDEGGRLSPEGKSQIDLLQVRVRQMAEMIDGVLNYARVGRDGQESCDVDLQTLVPAVVDFLAVPPSVEVSLEGSLPVVRGAPIRLQQVFQNLIGNAVKYMDKPEGRVRVSCAREGWFWRFDVEDNGPGIEERHFERIFQIFQTLAPKDRRDSTGVGLAIVKKIVQSAGGKVSVASRPGEGSRFSFTWPHRPECVGEPAAPAPGILVLTASTGDRP